MITEPRPKSRNNDEKPVRPLSATLDMDGFQAEPFETLIERAMLEERNGSGSRLFPSNSSSSTPTGRQDENSPLPKPSRGNFLRRGTGAARYRNVSKSPVTKQAPKTGPPAAAPSASATSEVSASARERRISISDAEKSDMDNDIDADADADTDGRYEYRSQAPAQRWPQGASINASYDDSFSETSFQMTRKEWERAQLDNAAELDEFKQLEREANPSEQSAGMRSLDQSPSRGSRFTVRNNSVPHSALRNPFEPAERLGGEGTSTSKSADARLDDFLAEAPDGPVSDNTVAESRPSTLADTAAVAFGDDESWELTGTTPRKDKHAAMNEGDTTPTPLVSGRSLSEADSRQMTSPPPQSTIVSHLFGARGSRKASTAQEARKASTAQEARAVAMVAQPSAMAAPVSGRAPLDSAVESKITELEREIAHLREEKERVSRLGAEQEEERRGLEAERAKLKSEIERERREIDDYRRQEMLKLKRERKVKIFPFLECRFVCKAYLRDKATLRLTLGRFVFVRSGKCIMLLPRAFRRKLSVMSLES